MESRPESRLGTAGAFAPPSATRLERLIVVSLVKLRALPQRFVLERLSYFGPAS